MTTRQTGPAVRRSRFSTIGFLLPLVALWGLPVLALVVVLPAASERESESLHQDLPATVPVGSRQADLRQAVTVTVAVTEPQDAVLATAGLVTAVHVEPGQVLATGDAVVSVDGRVVRAQLGAAPLFREVGPQAAGADVETVAAFLAATGHPAELGRESSYSTSLARAIRAYQKAEGLAVDGVFRPSDVVFVPEQSAAVQDVLLRVGDPVEVGTAVVAGAPVPTAVSFSSDNPVKVAGAPGPFVLEVGGQEVGLTSLTPDAGELGAVHTALAAAARSGAVQVTQENGVQTYSVAMLRLASAGTVGTVVSTAVWTSPDGVQCVFAVPGTAGASATAVVVTGAGAVGGELGLASVPEALTGTTVLRDPRSLTDADLSGCA